MLRSKSIKIVPKWLNLLNRPYSTPTESIPRSSKYSNFLPEFKPKESRVKHVHNQSFYEIDSDAIAKNANINNNNSLTWTSQYDSVVRQPFAKDVLHLQSLLDALLSSKNFDRADKILSAIYPLSTSVDEFMFSINKYLEVKAQQETESVSSLERYLQNFSSGEPLVYNDRTYAILLSKSLDSNDTQSYKKLIGEIATNSSFSRKVLSHVDVLGIDNLTNIFQDKVIADKHIPKDFIGLYEQINKTEVPEHMKEDYFLDENFNTLNIPSIAKDAEELKSVDSFGLKVVRHTLLGLNASSEGSSIINDLMKNLEKDLQTQVIHNFSSVEKRDYFALYNSLTTEQDKAKFNEALDLFNQARQRTIELRGADSAKEKWKHDYEEMMKRGSMHLAKSLNARLYEWFQDLLPFVKEEVNQCQKILNGEINLADCKSEDKALFKERSFYAPYLTLVPPEKMCAVTILELLRLNSTGGVVDGMRTARALVAVGRAIELEYKAQKLMESQKNSIPKKSRSAREWSKIIRVMNNSAKESSQMFNEWDSTLHAKVGSVLTSLLIHVAKVPVKGTDPTTGKTVTGSQPAFFHTYQYVQGQKIGILKLHKVLIRQLSLDVDGSLIQPHFLPMLTPPRPWTSYNEGGYLFSQSTLVRTRDSAETIAYLKAGSQRGDLDKVFEGLNVLGNTPWTVNRKVLEVMTTFWNTGEKFLDIPPIVEEPELPEPVSANAEPDVIRDYQKKVRSAINFASSQKSQRCDTNYRLEIARAFIGEKMFFPHNIDFRGRAYPMSPHFNHLGNDLTRSLFLFWNGKELGEKGLWWLKVHLANLYGIDKVPLHERAEFVEKNLDKVFESAKDPHNPKGWWTKGEKPWQVLGCCFELAEAYKLEDPTKFISHIPVHQDGSCNGLQHYAALGGDIEGARQVNLVPADKPQDVYTYVANLVQTRVNKDAEAGNKYAIFLQDKLTRKVVKQTVMTNVYGVTFIGAKDQIKKQIKGFFDKDSDEKVSDYAQYLTHHVFGSVRELFEGAHLIQDWLGESARIISKSVRADYEDSNSTNVNTPNHLSSVIWTTPLGLPCVQPYRSAKKQIIKTNLQDVSISDPFGASPVDSRKQKVALPPNFVHSLDATHMLMTAIACSKDKISFASVHDSFWTHAADIDTLNKNLRNQFVALHSDNLIEKVKLEFEARYKGFLQVFNISREHELVGKVQEVRRRIANDLNRALTLDDEIHLEKRRQELLASSDPEIVKIGKELVTTVSIVEDYDLSKLPYKSTGFRMLAPISFPEIPKRGDFDVNVVKDSTYFFS